MAQFNGCRAILSGPAGGVVGYATTAYDADDGRGVIGFDMGGTSTDVSRYAGTYIKRTPCTLHAVLPRMFQLLDVCTLIGCLFFGVFFF